jgi:hypothetical protein
VLRLIAAVLAEHQDESAVGRRYMTIDSLDELVRFVESSREENP